MAFKPKNKYVAIGLMLLCVVIASIIFEVVFSDLSGFFNVVRKFIQIISPFLYGLVFAFLMNPILKFIEVRLQKLLRKREISERSVRKISRVVGLIIAFIVVVALIYLVLALIVPNLIESVRTLIDPQTIIGYYNQVRNWITRLFSDNPDLQQWATERLANIFNSVEEWVENVDFQEAIRNVGSTVFNLVKGVLNFAIGLIAAIYMLISKERYSAQFKKILVACLSEERCDRFFDIGHRISEIFSGFIIGKIVDSLIIGVLCYIGMVILRLPYAVLISTIIGITNIIPFFGPIIGAVPSALLIFLVNPMQCLWFVVFVVVLQQLDGNVIGPRILGNSVGLSSFWILVSITVFGGIFGFAGMVLGVPCFAVIYMLISDSVTRRLKKKGQPLDTHLYGKIDHVEDLAQLEEQRHTRKVEEEEAPVMEVDPEEMEVFDGELDDQLDVFSDPALYSDDLSEFENEYEYEGLD